MLRPLRALALALWLLPPVAMAQPSIVAIGDLDDSSTGTSRGSSAVGVSSDGRVVLVNQVGIGLDRRCFRWSRPSGLDPLPWSDRRPLIGAAINSDGSVVSGTVEFGSGFGFPEVQVFRWRAGVGSSPLFGLGNATSTFGSVTGLSADGSVVCGWAGSGGNTSRNFAFADILDPSTVGRAMRAPGQGVAPPGHIRALAMSRDGDRALGYGTPVDGVGNSIPTLWTNVRGTRDVVAQDVRTVVGNNTAKPFAFAGDGTLFGTTGVAASQRLFSWNLINGFRDLGSSPFTESLFVNGAGTTAVGVTIDGVSIWRAGIGWQDLYTLADSLGVSLAGWSLDQVTGISDDGMTIVGNGLFNSGQGVPLGTGWVFTVPAPTPAALLTLVGFWVPHRRSRR